MLLSIIALSPCRHRSTTLHQLFRPIAVTILLSVSGSLYAETGIGTSSPVDLDIPASRKSATAIPSLPSQQVKKDLIVNGKVEIKRVELRGDVLFPRYGITEKYINQRLNQSFRKMSSWMTIADMHRLADELTLAYHEKGLTFNQVFVIPQEIKRHTVVMNVLAGQLTEVNVNNNLLYTDDQIRHPFAHLMGEVVYEPDIKRAMAEVNRLPGLKVFGFFSVGRRQGQTRLNLHARTETVNHSSLRFDNWGVQDTGSIRAIYQYQRNNLTENADTLQATLLSTDASGNLLGGVSYRAPLDASNQAGIGISRNQFEIAGDLSVFGLSGTLESLNGFWNNNLLYESNARADWNSSLAFKRSRVTSDIFDELLGETVDYSVLSSGFQAAVLASRGRIRQSMTVTPTVGFVSDSNNDSIDELFYMLTLGYGFQFRATPAVPAQYASTVSLEVLYTPQTIPASERASLTGGPGVRGYKPALFSADTTYRITLEQSLTQFEPWSGVRLLPFVFTDYAHGKQNDDQGNSADFIAAGLGLDFSYSAALSMRMTLGFPLLEQSTAPFAEEKFDPVFYGYVIFSF